MKIDSEFLQILRCPLSGEPLRQEDNTLVTSSGQRHYRLSDSGIPLFAEQFLSDEGRVQQEHYDRVANAYIANLSYPHTIEYTEYLDKAFMSELPTDLGLVAEICCGRAEAFRLLGDRVRHGIGIDVSLSMLEAARRDLPAGRFVFAQGDATMLPLATDSLDTVVMFGGIHHVNNRHRLFSEVRRVLKPGGLFYWREPVSDFFLWRGLRAVIYRFSPALDHETERPLLRSETIPVLEKVGMEPVSWKTYGFLGFCFFMNSDVLVFNRAFRFIPGIRAVTRAFARLDDMTVHLPGMRNAGLQVIGAARKPGAASA